MWEESQELEENLRKIKECVQRDLEDQIEEEYSKQGKQYQRTQKQDKMAISTKEVAKLLKEGYTRYHKDNRGYGSIQEKFGLTGVQVQELFSTPSLKHMKTVFPKSSLEIVDDLNESLGEENTVSPVGVDTTSNIDSGLTRFDFLREVVSEVPAQVVSEEPTPVTAPQPMNNDQLFS